MYEFLKSYYEGDIVKRHGSPEDLVDFMGRKYNTVLEMCTANGITPQVYYLRKSRGVEGKFLFSKEKLGRDVGVDRPKNK